MSEEKLNNLNVISQELLPTSEEIKAKLPISEAEIRVVSKGREDIRNIIDGKDPRFFVVVGPCSIHDVKAAHEYAKRLLKLSKELDDTLLIVMRVYFEKPRTTVGWKGLINDPYMDDSFHIEKGIHLARELLLYLTKVGLLTATEALDPITPQYLSDLISWIAIGARTTESQTHREMASGLSMPVGFKNGTDGSLSVAINALHSVSQPHHFLGINQQGQCSVFHTRGNGYGHVVLRGGGGKPNYQAEHIKECEAQLGLAGLPKNIVVDCSHGNSAKDYLRQAIVLADCVQQISDGNESIIGFMLESNLSEGNQAMPKDLSKLEYGVSVTDACINWETTAEILRSTREKLKPIVEQRR